MLKKLHDLFLSKKSLGHFSRWFLIQSWMHLTSRYHFRTPNHVPEKLNLKELSDFWKWKLLYGPDVICCRLLSGSLLLGFVAATLLSRLKLNLNPPEELWVFSWGCVMMVLWSHLDRAETAVFAPAEVRTTLFFSTFASPTPPPPPRRLRAVNFGSASFRLFSSASILLL